MKCIRCNEEMSQIDDLLSSHETHLCTSNNCPVMQFDTYGLDEYCYYLNFEKYPNIRIKTGKKHGKSFTTIIEMFEIKDLDDWIMKDLITFPQEMSDITLERLQTIITFG